VLTGRDQSVLCWTCAAICFVIGKFVIHFLFLRKHWLPNYHSVSVEYLIFISVSATCPSNFLRKTVCYLFCCRMSFLSSLTVKKRQDFCFIVVFHLVDHFILSKNLSLLSVSCCFAQWSGAVHYSLFWYCGDLIFVCIRNQSLSIINTIFPNWYQCSILFDQELAGCLPTISLSRHLMSALM
jgi:hypothetical protein